MKVDGDQKVMRATEVKAWGQCVCVWREGEELFLCKNSVFEEAKLDKKWVKIRGFRGGGGAGISSLDL